MLKRLIEVAFPLKEVSAASAKEKALRTGHIQTLHIWWARRPLAACRAVVFASLIPDPDDPACPESFRNLVREVLGRNEFRPKNGEGSTVQDTPRNRCLEFIKQLVKWENLNSPEYIEPARKLIAEAYQLLHPDAKGAAPKVLDPFAGGGAIPLEALRLGCEAHAIDLNPVAHLIELCTLVYPQKYGQPDSRPLPDYIKRLITHNKAKSQRTSAQQDLFENPLTGPAESEDFVPDIEISEGEYRRNPLAADVKYWGYWVLKRARREIERFYPQNEDGSIPVAYLWARTVTCANPSCGAPIPLVRQLWLSKKQKRKIALQIVTGAEKQKCTFALAEGNGISFDPNEGTTYQGEARCPFCSAVVSSKHIQRESQSGRMGEQLLCVVAAHPHQNGRRYRVAAPIDDKVAQEVVEILGRTVRDNGQDLLPQEPISKQQPRVMFVTIYGLTKWKDVFNPRQQLSLITFTRQVREAIERLSAESEEYARAVGTYLGLAVNRLAENSSTLCRWNPTAEKLQGTFGRQALPMVWDYCETSPFGGSVGSWDSLIRNQLNGFSRSCFPSSVVPVASQGIAQHLPSESSSIHLVATDPPYYDAVPYADLSDFFYVWLKRTVGKIYPALFRTLVTPKQYELIEERPHKSLLERKDRVFYETGMRQAFAEMNRVMYGGGVCVVMFAHKTTTAWESLIGGLLAGGMVVTSSWPLHTELKTRMRAMSSAALASSVTLICRKRPSDASEALWDDVRRHLQETARERLDFFWSQGIRGADFFISAIGPALSVFGRYSRVTRLSGEEVTVGQFLDEVRSLVTSYALGKILQTKHTASIDPETRFYVIWKWSYVDAKVPADEAFKLAQGIGFDTESMWGRTGVLLKSGENVQATPVAKRMAIKGLGEPNADTSAASLIDVLHRLCAFREKGDTQGMAEFLARSGQTKNPSLWVVAQAVSEILPDGDKEKQLMQGLLNQREQVEEMARQGGLFS